ncbi:MAG: T9SS type A sorting domain-containing protein [Sphingobacteriia bacterium]|nr:T9SS type A sorting domain-containing protein [Sphingobacteriia bacterium]
MKTLILLQQLLLFAFLNSLPCLRAQNFTDSNLPIVIINTDIDPNTGQPAVIPDEPKVLADMKVIYHPDGSRNYVSDQNNPDFLNYNGRIGIELRGTTSQMLPKKPYGLTTLMDDNVTNNNVSILGMPSENDWILNSFAYDPSLLRDALSYNLSRSIGNYSTRLVYCEVLINGDYKGLYIFMEKIKIDNDRINLVKLTTQDNSLPEVTGGYITKADKNTGGDPVAWTMPSYSGPWAWVDYIHDQPKPEDITQQQHNYIYNYFNAFQQSMTSGNSSLVNGYPSRIDIPSFIDFMIINELASNVDAYQYSTFFHKDRGGKLRAGPVWDLNLTYGNDLFLWGMDRSRTDVWQFNYENRGSKFWKDLFDHSTFNCYLTKRWNELASPGEPLSYEVICGQIDEIVDSISEAVVRENQRWGTIGNHPAQIAEMKTWLQTRINWLNDHLVDYQNCANPEVPELVINKIHYHPQEEPGFSDDDLEFIEILNNSNETVDLTGIYLREPGIGYQFPPNSIIGPFEFIRLAGNASVFEQFYGFEPFDEYLRDLSNKSFNLLLCDAFGNIIDQVHYFDSSPWPEEPDGDGPYLDLISPELDNSLPENWVASYDPLLFLPDQNSSVNLSLFPNPASTSCIIESEQRIENISLIDIFGKTVMNIPHISSHTCVITTEALESAVYFVLVKMTNGSVSRIKLVVI